MLLSHWYSIGSSTFLNALLRCDTVGITPPKMHVQHEADMLDHRRITNTGSPLNSKGKASVSFRIHSQRNRERWLCHSLKVGSLLQCQCRTNKTPRKSYWYANQRTVKVVTMVLCKAVLLMLSVLTLANVDSKF